MYLSISCSTPHSLDNIGTKNSIRDLFSIAPVVGKDEESLVLEP